jgi:hypothetical protein
MSGLNTYANAPAPGSLSPPAFTIRFKISASLSTGLVGLPPLALSMIETLVRAQAGISGVYPVITISSVSGAPYQFSAKLAYPTAVFAPAITAARCALALQNGLTVDEATASLRTAIGPVQTADQAALLNSAYSTPSCSIVPTNLQPAQKQQMVANLTTLLDDTPAGTLYTAIFSNINTYLTPSSLTSLLFSNIA